MPDSSLFLQICAFRHSFEITRLLATASVTTSDNFPYKWKEDETLPKFFSNHSVLSEYNVEYGIGFGMIQLSLEVYDESTRYEVPVIGNGVYSSKSNKI